MLANFQLLICQMLALLIFSLAFGTLVAEANQKSKSMTTKPAVFLDICQMLALLIFSLAFGTLVAEANQESCMTTKPAVFLDRDGTINVDKDYTYRLEDLVFETGAIEGLQILSTLPYLLIITTGQSGIGRGYYTEEQFNLYMQAMQEHLHAHGVAFDAVYHCPHHPEKALGDYRVDCACRKPKTGMIDRATTEFRKRGIEIDLTNSFVIGDKTDDGKMGNLAGCRSILVRCPSGKQGKDNNHQCTWAYEADTLFEAALWIKNHH